MKISKIEKVGKMPVYDLSVKDVEHYVLSNGVVTHNTGSYYASDNIFIMGRQQEKDGAELAGWNFIINVEKSRYVKEKSKIPITVKFDGGLSKWSGLLEMALESGHVRKPSNGWYSKVNMETGEIEDKKYRLKDTDTKEFWADIITSKSFNDWVKSRYQISHGKMITEDSTSSSDDTYDDEYQSEE